MNQIGILMNQIEASGFSPETPSAWVAWECGRMISA